MKPTILIVESNKAGNATPAIKCAQKLGMTAHLLARNPSEYGQSPTSPVVAADDVTLVETFNASALLRCGLDIHRKTPVTAVMAFDDYRVIPAAQLAEALGAAHGRTSVATARTRFKDQMRHTLAETPHSVDFIVGSVRQWQASPIGYPCVVKPLDETGSASVRVCNDDAEFVAACQAVADRAANPNSRGYAPVPEVLVEEYLPGAEFSAELCWDHGMNDWRLLGITSKRVVQRQACVESGHIFPHTFDGPVHDDAETALKLVLNTLGLSGTFAHVEFKMVDGVVRIIEVNPRPGGGQISSLMWHAKGIDVAEYNFAAHAGLPLRQPTEGHENTIAGIRFFVPTEAGIVKDVTLPPEIDGVVDTNVAAMPFNAQHVDSNDYRFGHIMVTGTSAAAVDRQLDAAMRDTIVSMAPSEATSEVHDS